MTSHNFINSNKLNLLHRRSILISTIGGLIGTSSICLQANAQAIKPQLQVGLIRNPVAGLIDVSARKGWFKEAGVDFKSILFAGAAGPKILQAMGGGSIGLSSVSSTAALFALSAEAIPMKIVSIATDPVPLFNILSSAGIKDIKDLAGKKVSAPQGTGLQYFLARALEKYGMSLKDIEYLNLPAGDAQSAFLAGRIDAIVPSIIGGLLIQKIKPDTKILFSPADFTKGPGSLKPMINYDVFVGSDSILNNQKDLISSFLSVYHERAVPYVKDKSTSSDAIKEINEYVNFEQKTPTDVSIIRELLVRSGFYDRAQTRRIISSDEFIASMEDQVKFFMDTGQMVRAVAIRSNVIKGLI
jgi:ABC-type nitrate/sulfonate/bicarbonate transport system substrate-binding protein